MRTYTVNDSFDIRSGMPVFDAGGQKVGLVTDVVGFGSTHLHDNGASDSSKTLTQASSSTGHFGVDPTHAFVGGTPNLRFGFSAIYEVVQGQGVTLTQAASAGLANRPNGSAPGSIPVDKHMQAASRWRLPWPLRRKDTSATTDV